MKVIENSKRKFKNLESNFQSDIRYWMSSVNNKHELALCHIRNKLYITYYNILSITNEESQQKKKYLD